LTDADLDPDVVWAGSSAERAGAVWDEGSSSSGLPVATGDTVEDDTAVIIYTSGSTALEGRHARIARWSTTPNSSPRDLPPPKTIESSRQGRSFIPAD
jgi:non-ribosomal peptide synthetase component F